MKIYPFPLVYDIESLFPMTRRIKRWAFGAAYSIGIGDRPCLVIDESILWDLYGDADSYEEDRKPDPISIVEFDSEKERKDYIDSNLNFAADCPAAGEIKRQPIQGPVREFRLGSMVSFSSVRYVMIRDDYDGLSWETPVERRYFLHRGENSFFGECLFGAGEPGCSQRFNSETISIPLDVMGTLFSSLENIRIQTGSYMPRVFRSAESVSLGFYLDTGNDRVVFSTESQGRYHKPWGIRIRGKGYLYQGRQIARVLRDLRPFLKQVMFGRLCREVKILSRPFWE